MPTTENPTTTSFVSGYIGVPGMEKLKGQSNYESWKFGMRMALIEYGLFGVIEGTDSDAGRAQRAFSKIYFTIDPACGILIKSCKNGKKAWDCLERAYRSTGLLRQISLKRTLYRVRREQYKTMSDYISGLLDIVHQLSELDVNIPDHEVGSLLLWIA